MLILLGLVLVFPASFLRRYSRQLLSEQGESIVMVSSSADKADAVNPQLPRDRTLRDDNYSTNSCNCDKF